MPRQYIKDISMTFWSAQFGSDRKCSVHSIKVHCHSSPLWYQKIISFSILIHNGIEYKWHPRAGDHSRFVFIVVRGRKWILFPLYFVHQKRRVKTCFVYCRPSLTCVRGNAKPFDVKYFFAHNFASSELILTKYVSKKFVMTMGRTCISKDSYS